MSDAIPESNQDSTPSMPSAGPTISERAGDAMGKANEILGKVDWSQMGKYGKAAGIIAVVIVAQIIIKVVIDTINFFPILPGLLELLGVVVVGQWSWQNLTTSDKRTAVVDKVQNLRKEYLG
ncbi:MULTISPECIES: CAAD domain-containing protein [Prochlorococcus]|uniref:CAAD domain-containing protein n=1 Tax=Prochlorococcus TaxID=1218 RepID=UPI000533B3F0|nr:MULTISPECIES: CAAD domain-containing protein [Prochlorococcus]KGG13591.1 putative membrane protein [Prochlorococcus sp. MIT 0601]